jgi:hypothetical protein
MELGRPAHPGIAVHDGDDLAFGRLAIERPLGDELRRFRNPGVAREAGLLPALPVEDG